MRKNQSILHVFMNTRRKVSELSDGNQIPEDWNKLMNDFYFQSSSKTEELSTISVENKTPLPLPTEVESYDYSEEYETKVVTSSLTSSALNIKKAEGELLNSFKGYNYVLLIGADQYEHSYDLDFPTKNLSEFKSLLVRKYNYTENNIYSLVNSDLTTENLEIFFDKLSNVMTYNDKLLVYFSGYSHYETSSGKSYWLSTTSKITNANSCIDHRFIVDQFNLLPTDRILLINDAFISTSYIVNSQNQEGRWILSSNDLYDTPDKRNNLFHRSLMRNLNKLSKKDFGTCEIGKYIYYDFISNSKIPIGNEAYFFKEPTIKVEFYNLINDNKNKRLFTESGYGQFLLEVQMTND